MLLLPIITCFKCLCDNFRLDMYTFTTKYYLVYYSYITIAYNFMHATPT